MERSDFLIVGNYSHDLLIHSRKKILSLGGPPAYISRIFDALGANYKIVSKVGKDFKYFDEVSQKPIISNKPTASMEHIHRKGKLVSSKMIETGAKIMVKDIKTKAKVTIIGSHVNEVPPETIRFLRKKSKLILADAQGMMRKIDDKKNVLLTNLKKTSFWNVLDKVDFLKMSEEEAELVDLSEIKKKTTLVITLSKKGCWIISEKENTSVPTTPLGEKDSTGAGDFFLAGFSWALHKGLPLKTCAEIANYCGGLAVKAVGLPKVTHEMIKGTLLATQGKLSH